MVGQEIVYRSSSLGAEFVVDAGAVEIFGQRAFFVIDQNVESVVRELCVFLPARTEPLDAAAECVVPVPHLLFPSRGLDHPILVVPRIAPEIRAFAFRFGIAVLVKGVAGGRS